MAIRRRSPCSAEMQRRPRPDRQAFPHRPSSLRHRQHQIRLPEPQLGQRLDPEIPLRQLFAHQIRAGDAQMDPPRCQFARDLARGKQNKLHVIRALDDARIFALRPRPAQRRRRAHRTSQRSFPSAAPWTARPDLRLMQPPQFHRPARAGSPRPPPVSRARAPAAGSAHHSARQWRRRQIGAICRIETKDESRHNIPFARGHSWPRNPALDTSTPRASSASRRRARRCDGGLDRGQIHGDIAQMLQRVEATSRARQDRVDQRHLASPRSARSPHLRARH